jgi:hypothetical protein
MPGRAVGGERPARHQAMQMDMAHQRLTPAQSGTSEIGGHRVTQFLPLSAAARRNCERSCRRDTERTRLVDLGAGLVTVRDTKCGKSRYLPIHPSTQRALRDDAERRNRLCPHP